MSDLSLVVSGIDEAAKKLVAGVKSVTFTIPNPVEPTVAVWVKSGPDSLGRVHYVRYWPTDYLPGHPDGEGGLVRGQCFFGAPPEGVHRFEARPTARELHSFFYPDRSTPCADCDGTGIDPDCPHDQAPYPCGECGGCGTVQKPTDWTGGDADDVPAPASWDQTFDDGEVPR